MLRLRPSVTVWLVLTLAATVVQAKPPASEVPKKRVLIVTGVDWKGHLWKKTAPVLRDLLEKDSRLEARIVEDPAFLASPAVDDYDVLLLHFKNYDPIPRQQQVQQKLVEAVRNGKGLVLLHFACGAFEDWPEFRNLAGKVWDKKNTHDPYGSFTVRIVDRQHPVTRGLQDFVTRDELYICLTGERPVQVLAVARSVKTGRDHPMAFVFSYGRGRVFHTPLGHNVESIRGAAELIRRGTAWAAGLEPR